MLVASHFGCLVARLVGLAPYYVGLVADRFRRGLRRVYLVARWFGLVADLFRRGLRRVYLVARWFGRVARWFGLVAGFLVGGRVWLVAIFVWGLSSGVV